MALTHSIMLCWNKPPKPMSIKLTVQLPPIQFLPPLPNEASITLRLTGSKMITASSAMRRLEAASIQWPFQPAARSWGYTAWG